MKRVYKYPFEFGGDEFEIPMPKGAKPLNFQFQFDTLCVWALVDPEAPMVARKFRIAGTGHDIENADELTYVGSVQMQGGALIFHLFVFPEDTAPAALPA